MRPARPLRGRTVGWGLIVAAALVAAVVLVTWRATSPLLFLLYPVLVLGALALLALGVLWALRHF
jgi:hypothetical protein